MTPNGSFSLKVQLFSLFCKIFVRPGLISNSSLLFFCVTTEEQISEVVLLCFCTDGSAGSVKAEEEEVQDYRVKCLNNLAAAQLKLEHCDEALHTSRDVLTLEPNNVKALFRTGKVRAHSVVLLLRENHCKCQKHLI